MVLVESVTVGLVREADNGSSGASVVISFCGWSRSRLRYHMIRVSLNLLYVCGLMLLVNSSPAYMCCGLDSAANPKPGFFVRPKLDEVAVWALCAVGLG